jgi:hypothetical protein
MHTIPINPPRGSLLVRAARAFRKLLSGATAAMTKPLPEERSRSWMDWPRFPPY